MTSSHNNLPSYDFSENSWETASFSKKQPPDETALYADYANSIGLGDHAPVFEVRLKEFVAVAHIGAWWFNNRMRAAFFIRWAWFAVSLVFLLGILAAAYFAPSLLPAGQDEGPQSYTAIGTNITLLLTALILVFRTINGWVGSTADIANYWKGRSDLLDLIYTLQTEFRGKDFETEETRKEFKVALETKIAAARTATRAAMKEIISSLQAPKLDLDALANAQTKASSFYTTFFTPGLNARTQQLQAIASAESARKAKEALPGEIAALYDAISDTDVKILNLLNLIENPVIPDGVEDTPAVRKHLADTYKSELKSLGDLRTEWKEQLAKKELQLKST